MSSPALTAAHYQRSVRRVLIGIMELNLIVTAIKFVVGALALLVYVRRNKLSLSRYLDIAAHALIIGQAIGRWGNLVNQELYGPPTNLPWGIRSIRPIATANTSMYRDIRSTRRSFIHCFRTNPC
jgi:prolipoprotein diacylglyceryltransferase